MAGFSGSKKPHDPTLFKHEPLAMFCYFLMGCGFLTGWNAFLTATDFFNAAFPNRSIDRVFTILYLPITFSLVGLVSRFPNILWTSRVRILAGYTLFTLSTAIIPVIDAALIKGQGSISSELAYGLVLLAVALVAIGDGISQGTVYGDAAILPDKYTQAVVMGAAASGVIIGVIRVVTKGALLQQGQSGLRVSTQIYFACSAAITAACILLYELVMPRLDVIRHYRGKLKAERVQADLAARKLSESSATPVSPASFINISVTGQRLEVLHSNSSILVLSAANTPKALSPRTTSPTSQHSVKDVEPNIDTAAAAAAAAAGSRFGSSGGGVGGAYPKPSNLPSSHPAHQLAGGVLDNPAANGNGRTLSCSTEGSACYADARLAAKAAAGTESEADRAELGPLTWMNILKLNWRLCVAVFVVYAVTLSIFPGFLAENVHSAVLKDWYPVLLIFTFNISDFLGRCTPDFGWHPRQTTLLLLALARLVVLELLYPLLSIKGAGEAVFFILTFVLGLSNGYLTALIFMAAPRGLSPSAAELAGNVNVFCELGGLTVGAFMGWLWNVGKA